MLKVNGPKVNKFAAGEFAEDRIGDEETGQRQVDNIPAALSPIDGFPRCRNRRLGSGLLHAEIFQKP